MPRLNFGVGNSNAVEVSLEDEPRSGCPLDATDEEICKEIRDLVYMYSDRRI